MPINPNLLAGLSNATVPTVVGANQPASGYIIGNTNASDRIEYNITRANTTSTLEFPTDLPKYHFVLVQNEWQTNGQLTAEAIFRLPLPTPLTDTFEVDYDQNVSYLGDLLSKISNLSQTATSVAQLSGAALGLQLNTFKTVTMSAPKYRSFDFTWKLSPKNFQEAQTIRRITASLRKHMSPRTTTAGKLVLQFPKIYTMWFNPNVRYLFKFKPCVLMALAIDYQGGNPFPGFYKAPSNFTDFGSNSSESPPESVTVSTKWLELEYWIDEDYKESGGIPTNNPFDAWNYYTYDTSPGTPSVPLTDEQMSTMEGFF
jgi:hypothetical protein